MGYSEIDTKPGAAHSSDPASNKPYFPYKQHEEIPNGPNLVLRPPPGTKFGGSGGPDPATSVLLDTQNKIRRYLREIAAPWLVMPPDGESYHLAAGIALPAIGATFTPVVTIKVPSGRNGVLNRIANTFIGGGFNDFSGNIIWQIQRNPQSGIAGAAAAERNYQNIQASLGMTNNPAFIAPIRIYENDIIVLAVENVSVVVAGQLIGGLLGGWFYPRALDDAETKREDATTSW